MVLQVFWIGKLLRFDQRALICSVEWQQPYVHEAGVQVFWSGSNHGVAATIFWSGSNHGALVITNKYKTCTMSIYMYVTE